MPYFITADGGGTKTEVVLFDLHGKILSRVTAKGSNPVFMDFDIALDNIKKPISKMLKEQNLQISDLEKIVLFVPGMRKHRQEIIENFNFSNIEIMGDEIAAFYGAFGGNPGIAVLSGTGSFAIGRRERGQFITVGGWGSLFGDEGSGYSIGIQILRSVTASFDLNEKETPLAAAVKRYFHIESIDQIKSRQKDSQLFSREKIAGLCKIAAQYAAKGDTAALDILDHAANQLAILALACAKRLNVTAGPFSCALIGGVSKMGELIERPLKKHLNLVCPELQLCVPIFEPIVGTILYVLESCNVDITSSQLAHSILQQYQNI